MKIAIINGTNRIDNQSSQIAYAAKDQAVKAGYTADVINLDNFDELFRGDYITGETATMPQKVVIAKMTSADILLFIVPTYHSGLPSSLKNFFDSLRYKPVYENKVIGIIAGSTHNQDLGARQAAQTINGILSHNKVYSFVVPRITILEFQSIDTPRLDEYLNYLAHFRTLYKTT